MNYCQSKMNDYAKQNRNENSHPALKIFKCWVLQFCLFPFNFLLSKLINQFESIMQNKPNLLNAQMNVTSFYAAVYENIANCKLGENKPNSKPIKPKTKPNQTQFPKSQNEIKLLFNKGL